MQPQGSNRHFAPLLAGLLSLAGCGIETSSMAPIPPIPAEVDRLASWMTGSFDNTIQTTQDPQFLPLSLHACQIWPDRTDGRWIYTEQARLDAPGQPDRQQIHRLRIDGQGQLVSEVFAFRSGEKPAAGAWRNPKNLDRIDPFLLLPQEGCAVHLEFDTGTFSGGTSGTGCENARSGAAYETTEVTIQRDRITSWNRGFNDAGDQMWGSKSGAYVFNRTTQRTGN